MPNYEQYYREIRNKLNPNKTERAYMDRAAQEAAAPIIHQFQRLTDKYRGEPKFIREVTAKLIEHVSEQLPDYETAETIE